MASSSRARRVDHPQQLSKLIAEAQARVLAPGPLVRAVGLDLGTNTGITVCCWKPGDPPTREHASILFMGQLDLSAATYESRGSQVLKLLNFLEEVRPAMVCIENIRNTPVMEGSKINMAAILARAATAMEFFGALQAMTSYYCEIRGIPLVPLPIGEIKRYATGKGNANKVEMIQACNAAFGTDFATEGYETTGVDNIADSVFVLMCGLAKLGQGVISAEIFEGADDGRE